MIEGLEQLYERIAKLIQEAIPEDWAMAKLEAVFYSDMSECIGEYTRASDGAARSFATGLAGQRAFRELRQRFKEAGQPLWGGAVFELSPDGKFNVKWIYDNCDEHGDTLWNEVDWRRRQEDRHRRLTQ